MTDTQKKTITVEVSHEFKATATVLVNVVVDKDDPADPERLAREFVFAAIEAGQYIEWNSPTLSTEKHSVKNKYSLNTKIFGQIGEELYPKPDEPAYAYQPTPPEPAGGSTS